MYTFMLGEQEIRLEVDFKKWIAKIDIKLHLSRFAYK